MCSELVLRKGVAKGTVESFPLARSGRPVCVYFESSRKVAELQRFQRTRNPGVKASYCKATLLAVRKNTGASFAEKRKDITFGSITKL